MGKLFKYLKKHAGIALVIVCVLFIQAFCDLSLPSYTSDIVNIGIQQNGIDTSVPEQIAKEDLEKLLLLIPQEDTEKVTDAYREGTESDLKTEKDFFVLKDSVKNSEEKIENLTDIMGRPMLLAEGFDQDSKEIEVMKEQITAQLPQGMLPEDADMFDILAVMPQEQREAMVS